MKQQVERASIWIYRGIWAVLVEWFRVPKQSPTLPVRPGDELRSFQPALGFLRYLKFFFWIGLVVIDLLILAGWLAITVAWPLMGAMLALPALFLAVVPDIVVYIAIHLRYDTTWYVMTDWSLRIRRGIWIIHETTITFDNVQDIKVTQGPVQRYFGIADVLVETAGGGGKTDQHGSSIGMAHRGLIEGVADAKDIRDQVLARVRRTHTAGLGDEEPLPYGAPGLSPEHIQTLREIRDLTARLAAM